MKKAILTLGMATLLTIGYANTEIYPDRLSFAVITVNKLNNLELNPFCKSILEGDIQTVKKLINLGEDVNRKSLGMTPAMYAARYNKSEILELLIRNGAKLSIKSDQGFTAKKYAQLANANNALTVINSSDKR